MKVLLPFLLPSIACASLLDGGDPLTLDQGEFSRIWQEVRSGVVSTSKLPATTWQRAMLAEDAEVFRVLLLAWLQQHNPQSSVEDYAPAYADAVALHRKALAGQPAACAALAAAYRAGHIASLGLPQSEEKARWFEQRALIVENLPQ